MPSEFVVNTGSPPFATVTTAALPVHPFGTEQSLRPKLGGVRCLHVVGESVGLLVGFFVGFAVGLLDGLLVGFLLGFFVGLRVGFVVGLLLGLAVGLRVGKALGDRVAARLFFGFFFILVAKKTKSAKNTHRCTVSGSR